MLSPFAAANKVRSTLALDPLNPSYALISYGLVNARGTLGAYIDNGGNLVNASGVAFSTSNSIQNVTFTDPGTGATVTLADGSTFATVGAHTSTFTFSADTAVTFPTSGTLSTLAGSESLSNKTIVAGIFTTSERHSFVNTPVAAAGSTNADAAALTAATLQHVTSDSTAKGVILPVGVAGYRIEIVNNSATACKIYPDSGGAINGGTTTTGSVTIPASKGVIATCTAAGTWTVRDMTALSA